MREDKTFTKIPHFDGHYDHWSELMENLVRAKGLWSVVKIGLSKGSMECGKDWFLRTRGRNNVD